MNSPDQRTGRPGGRQRSAALIVALIAFTTAGCSVWPGRSGLAPLPEFAGTWLLNVERSDDPTERMREAMPGHQGPGRFNPRFPGGGTRPVGGETPQPTNTGAGVTPAWVSGMAMFKV